MKVTYVTQNLVHQETILHLENLLCGDFLKWEIEAHLQNSKPKFFLLIQETPNEIVFKSRN